MKKIRVAELFAGVGGFRVGLEGYPKNKDSAFEVVWSNQWEPATKTQHASMVYESRWGKENHVCEDISTIPVKDIPEHDLLVGGFPCQDYSVATTLKNSKGLHGKKGVLWWEIHRILDESNNKPNYLLLENVDRLLKSPATQRGRDFAVMLTSLNNLGYAVEWKVINAAEYGMPQRRRRTYIVGYHKSSDLYKKMTKLKPSEILTNKGVVSSAFPSVPFSEKGSISEIKLSDDIASVSENFNKTGTVSPFKKSGFLLDGTVYTVDTKPEYKGEMITLGSILETGKVADEFYIKPEDIEKWQKLKGAKSEPRKSKDGHVYHYSEGAMAFPDDLNKPSRTIITGEGGPSASRFKHVVQTEFGLRRLTPLELERLSMFPENHTVGPEITNLKRAFFIGNALVVGVIEKIGKSLYGEIEIIEDSTK
jgi:DNA (cytosine-5)-methyltransferase 1